MIIPGVSLFTYFRKAPNHPNHPNHPMPCQFHVTFTSSPHLGPLGPLGHPGCRRCPYASWDECRHPNGPRRGGSTRGHPCPSCGRQPPTISWPLLKGFHRNPTNNKRDLMGFHGNFTINNRILLGSHQQNCDFSMGFQRKSGEKISWLWQRSVGLSLVHHYGGSPADPYGGHWETPRLSIFKCGAPGLNLAGSKKSNIKSDFKGRCIWSTLKLRK